MMDAEERKILERYLEVRLNKAAWLRDQAAGLRRAAASLDSAASELEARQGLEKQP